MSDPYIADVSLQLLGNGSNGDPITDSSLFRRTVTEYGGCTINDSASKWGTTSIYFDFIDNYLSIPYHADLQPPVGSGNWTLEAQIYTGNNATLNQFIYDVRGTSSESGCSLVLDGNTLAFMAVLTTGEVYLENAANGVGIASNTWYHVAVVKNGTNWKLYVNGSTANSDGSITSDTQADNYLPTTKDLRIGRNHQPSYDTLYFRGFMNDYRITKGVARYTADFTPPTAQFEPATTGSVAALSMPTLTAFGYFGGFSHVASPRMEAVAGGAIPVSNIVTAKARVTAYGGASAAIFMPRVSAVASGHDSTGENDAKLTLSSPSLIAYGGANSAVVMPSLLATAVGTAPVIGTAAITLPRTTVAASGTISGTGSAALTVTDNFRLIGFSGAICSVTLAGSPTVTATGVSGGVGSAAITLPLFELAATGSQPNVGGASLLMPSARLGATAQAWLLMPAATLTAIGSATVAVTYEAYALNLGHAARGQGQDVNDELTRFTNYPFDKIIRYKNSYFGVNSTGLYLLEGTTDDAAPIAYHAKTKLTDFGTDQKKTPEAAIFGGRLGPDATVTVYTGETEDDVYAYSTPRGQDVQNYRQKFGKGLKARYYAFGIQGDGEMAIDTVSFDLATLKRRI